MALERQRDLPPPSAEGEGEEGCRSAGRGSATCVERLALTSAGQGGGAGLSLVGVGVGGEGLFLEEDGVVGKAWF